jgi:uncharacterized membrane protein YphA (DoxX/SURF4 family)
VTLTALVARARRRRALHVLVAIVRILVGFAFVPAGLKKLLGQPFTDPHNTGAFHEFLHAFHATGWFYRAVGVLQLLTATLLITQRFATAGAIMAFPITLTIMLFCWSTRVYFTASIVTLMVLALTALLGWDLARWRGIFGSPTTTDDLAPAAPIDVGLWQWCGIAILVVYFASCLAMGEVYRPKGAKLDEPAFYVFPTIMLLPIVTLVVEQRRRRRLR